MANLSSYGLHVELEEESTDSMEWATLNYSESDIIKAGDVLTSLAQPQDYEMAYEILNNWRASHSFPLNTFQMRLRSFAEEVTHNPVVAQRLKRSFSIITKLH